MGFITKLLLFMAAIGCLLLSPAKAQSEDPFPVPMITVHYAQSSYIGEAYVYNGIADRSYPGIMRGTYDGHLYRIDLMIILDNFTWNKPLEVQCVYPNGNIKTVVINTENYTLYPNRFYEFSIELKTFDAGWIKVEPELPDNTDWENVQRFGSSVCLEQRD
ncbi:MAG: hypothetical protein ACM3U0_00840 [archaeon]